MNPVVEDIKDILEAESGLELELATNLFIGKEPANPDLCVTLYDTGGRGPVTPFDRTEKYYYQTFQVRVRSKGYLEGMTLALDVMDSLHGRGHEEWNDAVYELIVCESAPCLIGRDDSGRALITANYSVQRRES